MVVYFVAQPPGINCCAQACCAMLSQMSLEDACAEFGHSHSSYTREVIRFLRNHGYTCPDRLKPVKKDKTNLPDLCILKLRFGELPMGHMVLYHDGVVYDPSLGKKLLNDYDGAATSCGGIRITSYLPLSRG